MAEQMQKTEVSAGGHAPPPMLAGGKKQIAKTAKTYRRFHGSVKIDPPRIGHDASRIGEPHIICSMGLRAG